MHLFFYIFIAFLFLSTLWECLLTLLNIAHVKKNRAAVPAFYKDKITFEVYQKSVEYTLVKSWYSLFVQLLSIPIIAIAIISGVFNVVDLQLSNIFSAGPLTHSVLYCFSIGIGLMILKLPVTLISQFVIEQKFGFNKMTAKTFVSDFIKGLLLAAILGVPLLYLVFWLYQIMEENWWWVTFVAVFFFELFVAAIYPTFLAPIFNKFVPLPDGSLKDAITSIAQKINFKMSGIFTIDGSKRSTHSNAYFAGLGKFRRIVMFDTLVSSMTEEEIISVLAHEMGHNKLKHIQKHLIMSAIMGLGGFWILSQLINWTPFYDAFGAGSASPHKGFMIFALFSGVFTFWMTPFTNWLSRKHEYEADAFSVEVTGRSATMSSSLLKLSKDNLSNLSPHPWYSFYHYSHPTTEERVKAIS